MNEWMNEPTRGSQFISKVLLISSSTNFHCEYPSHKLMSQYTSEVWEIQDEIIATQKLWGDREKP